MDLIKFVGLAVVSLCTYLYFYPGTTVSDAYYDQFCISRGCCRKVRIQTFGSLTRESDISSSTHCLASYAAALLGPCPKHKWVSFHGGGEEYKTGIAYFLLPTSQFSCSGSPRENVNLCEDTRFDCYEQNFRRLFKRDRLLLKRVLRYIFSRYQKDRWSGLDKFKDLLADSDLANGIENLRRGLARLEKEP